MYIFIVKHIKHIWETLVFPWSDFTQLLHSNLFHLLVLTALSYNHRSLFFSSSFPLFLCTDCLSLSFILLANTGILTSQSSAWCCHQRVFLPWIIILCKTIGMRGLVSFSAYGCGFCFVLLLLTQLHRCSLAAMRAKSGAITVPAIFCLLHH